MKNQSGKNKSPAANSAVTKEDCADVETILIASAFAIKESVTDHWIIDSGATQHMSHSRDSFSQYKLLDEHVSVEVGDGRYLKGVGVGEVLLTLSLPNNKSRKCTLTNVLHVPELHCNLVSVNQASSHGKMITFSENLCKIFDNKKNLLATANKVGKLYLLNCTVHVVAKAMSIKKASDDLLWHRRFCHLNMNSLKSLKSKDLVSGIDCKFSNEASFCECCCEGKNHKLPFSTSDKKRDLKPLDLIHSDVCGNISPATLGGGNYFVTFIDDASRYTWVYVLKHKSEVFSKFKEWKSLVENLYDRKIKTLRSDNGGEYTSIEFEDFLKNEGIRHEKTIPKTPEQNGVAERKNRTLVEAVRTMIADSNLSKTFWGEALSTAVYVQNRSPTTALNGITPYQVLNDRKPNVKHFRVFGCLAFAHVPKEERGKLDSKSRKCVLLGYGSVTKGYRLYDLSSKKILYSRDVIFNEQQCVTSQKEDDNNQCSEFPCTNSTDDNSCPDQNRRSKRIINEPDKYGEWVYSCSSVTDDPKTVKEALSRPDASKWQAAMELEMKAMSDNNVWSLEKSTNGRSPINSKWIFKRKTGPDGSITSYKARLVAQGFSQKHGIDYDQTFSPVVRFESVRTLLALAAQHNLQLHQMDVSSAFLNGEISEELYLVQPEGFETHGKEDYYCRLNKSIYGLKQAPKCWNSSLDNFLKELKFKQSSSDSCIYVNNENSVPCYIAVYVDDIIIASESVEQINNLKCSLSGKYNMKDLGRLSYFLGVNIEQNENSVFINQSAYVNKLLNNFGFDNANPVATPADISSVLEKASDDSDLFDPAKYQSAVGSLLYLSTKSRPDLTFAVCNVAKYCSKPTNKHWTAVKRIFRYLKGTVNYGIVYKKKNPSNFVGYSDSDWAGDKSDRKSTSGYCFQFCNGLISWRTSKQTCVALSTAEAEYVALSAAAQEAVWLKQLFIDLNINSNEPVKMYEDNQSAICLAENPKDHSKTKHIAIKYHYLRDLVANNEIEIEYCNTEKMLADMFTKALPAEKFVKLRNMIGMSCI